MPTSGRGSNAARRTAHAFAPLFVRRRLHFPLLEKEPRLWPGRLFTTPARTAGFTLIEILAVTVIMGIALAINFLLQALEHRARVHRPDYATAQFAAEA